MFKFWSCDFRVLCSNSVSALAVLHLWIHSLTFIIRIAAHLRAGHLVYDETVGIKADCEKALKEIQQVMLPPRDVSEEERARLTKDDMEGVALSFPDSSSTGGGNTNTGNAARRCLLKDHLRERLITTVPAEHQDDFR